MSSSGYALWSVVAGEQPTTAKWNILGNNDASFNSGVGFNDGILITRHFASSGLQLPDKIYNPYKFSANLNGTSQSVSTGVWTKVALANKLFDTNNNFDSVTNYRYTIPISGFYWIVGSVGLSTSGVTSNTATDMAIYKNGSAFRVGSQIAGSGSATIIPRTHVTDLVQLTAGDYLELWGYINDGSRQFDGGTSVTYMTAILWCTT